MLAFSCQFDPQHPGTKVTVGSLYKGSVVSGGSTVQGNRFYNDGTVIPSSGPMPAGFYQIVSNYFGGGGPSPGLVPVVRLEQDGTVFELNPGQMVYPVA